MATWTALQIEQREREQRDRLETALRELEHLAHQTVETHVTDQWEQNRLFNEIHKIVNNGFK